MSNSSIYQLAKHKHLYITLFPNNLLSLSYSNGIPQRTDLNQSLSKLEYTPNSQLFGFDINLLDNHSYLIRCAYGQTGFGSINDTQSTNANPVTFEKKKEPQNCKPAYDMLSKENVLKYLSMQADAPNVADFKPIPKPITAKTLKENRLLQFKEKIAELKKLKVAFARERNIFLNSLFELEMATPEDYKDLLHESLALEFGEAIITIKVLT